MKSFKSKELDLIQNNFIRTRNENSRFENRNLNVYINHWFYIFDQIIFYHSDELPYNFKINNVITLVNILSTNEKYVPGIKSKIIDFFELFNFPFTLILLENIIYPAIYSQNKIKFLDNFRLFFQGLLINQKFNHNLKKSFENLVRKSSFSYHLQDLLISCAPNSFFCESIIYDGSHKINLYCSPQIFLEFNFLSRFILIKNINIVGLQHGCGYGLFNKFPSLDYEKSISNKYLGWGFLEDNIVQTRFGRAKSSSKSSIYWIGRAQPPKISQGLDGEDIYNITYYNVESIDFIENLFSKCNLNFVFLAHPHNSHYYYNQSILQNSPKFSYVNSESLICLNDIVIFDTFTSTLIYYCLHNRIKFLIISSSDLLLNATTRYLNFIEILKKYNYYIDTNLGLQSCISNLNMFLNYYDEDIWTELDAFFQTNNLVI